MAYGSKTVTNVATKIISANYERKTLCLTNLSESVLVYIGPDASVTTANGFPLYQTQSLDNKKVSGFYLGDIYGITASSTADVRYWETT